MQKISIRMRWIGGGVIILLVCVAIVLVHHFHLNTVATNTAHNNTTSTAGVGIALTSTGQNSVVMSPQHVSSSVPIIPGPSIIINLLTPGANNIWTIGQPNSIAWSNPANISGEIDLVDKTTKAFIGVIISNIGPNQTSYFWDARSIYRARYSADKTDVIPGIYSIRIHFDGNGLGDLISGPITISK